MLKEVTARLIDLDRRVHWQTTLIQELKARPDPGGHRRAPADVVEATATLANLLLATNEARADQRAIIVDVTGLCVLVDTRPGRACPPPDLGHPPFGEPSLDPGREPWRG